MGEDDASAGSGLIEMEEGKTVIAAEKGGRRPDDAEAGGWGGGFFHGAESVYCPSSNPSKSLR